MKIYSMLDILSTPTSKNSENKIKKWIEDFKDSKRNWNFDELNKWAFGQKNKSKLLKYIEVFEENM